MEGRSELIEKLTGIRSSKKSYYVDLKKKMAEVERRNAQLEIISQLARRINVDMSAEEIMEEVWEKLRQVVRFDRLSLYILEGDRLVLRTSVPKGQGVLGEETRVSSPHSLFWTAISEHRSLFRADIENDELEFAEDSSLIKARVRSVGVIPLLAGEMVLGVLVLKYRQEGGWDEESQGFLEQFASQLAICLKNAGLYSQVLLAKHQWEKTFDAVTDLLLCLDNDLQVIQFNRAVPRFFGLEPEALFGRKCYALFFDASSPCARCPAKEAMQTARRAYMQYRLPRGATIDVFAYPVVTGENKPEGAILYAKDVTHLVNSFKLVALGEMAAGVAHELNSPLTAIVGDAQLLLRDLPRDTPGYELLYDIRNCGNRCRETIRSLLAFSRQEEYTFALTQLNEVVERALNLLVYQIEKNQITVTKELAPDLPLIWGNATRLEQIVVNLLLNSRDALEGKNGQKRITLTTSRLGTGEVALTVEDTGRGIPAEIMPFIFNPFFTTKKPGKGTGLGLSVSLGIAQAHGGRLEVTSKVGEGSRFTLILPVASTAKKEIAADGEG